MLIIHACIRILDTNVAKGQYKVNIYKDNLIYFVVVALRSYFEYLEPKDQKGGGKGTVTLITPTPLPPAPSPPPPRSPTHNLESASS